MIKGLKSLYENLKIKFVAESDVINFLIKFASYERQWKAKVESLAKNNPKPFNSWLDGKPRIYFDFKPISSADVPIDEEVEELLEGAGYQITDYVQGYCQKNGTKFRIGKIIQKLLNDSLKEAEKAYPASPEKNDAILKIKEDFLKIQSLFLNSEFRSNKSYLDNLKIVISQDPHDLAKMSYERGWTSCMDLGKGERQEDLFCEIRQGGLVSYLISGNDLEIKSPLARIHIRRMVGLDGLNIAKPEQTVYGNEVPGYLEFINKWVDQHNNEQFAGKSREPVGAYKIKGSEWSDTYENIFVIPPEKKDSLIEWFDGRVPDTTITTWTVIDNYYDEFESYGFYEGFLEDFSGERSFDNFEDAQRFKNILENHALDYEDILMDLFLTDEYKETLIEEGGDEALEVEINNLKNNRFQITSKTNDYGGELQDKAVEALVEKFADSLGTDLAEKIIRYLNTRSYRYAKLNLYEILFSKYPEVLTQEFFYSFNIKTQVKFIDFFDTNNPEKADELYTWSKQLIKNKLDVDGEDFNKNIKYNQIPGRDSYENLNSIVRYIDFIMSQILNYKIDDEFYEIIRHFMEVGLYKIPQFINSQPELLEESVNKIWDYLAKIVRPDKMTTKSKIDLAMLMLKHLNISKWEFDPDSSGISIHEWLYFVKGLGSAGAGFIPKINEFLKNVNEDVESNQRFKHFTSYNSLLRDDLLERKDLEIKNRIREINHTLDCLQNDLTYSKIYSWN